MDEAGGDSTSGWPPPLVERIFNLLDQEILDRGFQKETSAGEKQLFREFSARFFRWRDRRRAARRTCQHAGGGKAGHGRAQNPPERMAAEQRREAGLQAMAEARAEVPRFPEGGGGFRQSCAGGGEFYYTADHYRSFRRIVE